jgi:hypothetical protein
VAILGKYIDIHTTSRAGDALGSLNQMVTLTTTPHSLPATSANAIFMNLRSSQDLASPRATALQLLGLGGNASLNTIGFVAAGGATAASAPTVMFDVVSVVFHSIIR